MSRLAPVSGVVERPPPEVTPQKKKEVLMNGRIPNGGEENGHARRERSGTGMKTPEPEVPKTTEGDVKKAVDPMQCLASKGTDQRAAKMDEGVELGNSYGSAE